MSGEKEKETFKRSNKIARSPEKGDESEKNGELRKMIRNGMK